MCPGAWKMFAASMLMVVVPRPVGSIQCVFKYKSVDSHPKFLIHIYEDIIFSFAFFSGSLLLLDFLFWFLMHGGCVATSVWTQGMCLRISIKMIRNSNGWSFVRQTSQFVRTKHACENCRFSAGKHIESRCVDCYLSCGSGCHWFSIVVVVIRSVRTVKCSWINFHTIFAFQYTFFLSPMIKHPLSTSSSSV